ncbi:MAG: glycosyltransferase family 2 protein [Chloroflexi bacterium]|nr:glycosyltransferase family 2 protein [Chloroflexota bacterium]
MLDLSIIIVNWNTRDLLLKCLGCVYNAQRSLTMEVIVVDNHSNDESVDAARQSFPQTRFIENPANYGFAKANNQGIRQAQGRYLLLLNSDAFVHEEALTNMVQFMDAHADTGAGGCRLFFEDGSLQRSCFSFPTLLTEFWQLTWLDRFFPRSRTFGKYRMTYWDMTDSHPVDAVMGACLILRKEALDQIGLLDEQFFMFSEEIDLCYRLKQAGWLVRYIPHASAVHLWGGSSSQVKEETFLHLYRSRIRFFRKHYGMWTTCLYKGVLFLGSLLRVILAGISRILRGENEESLKGRHYRRLLISLWSM